jgi:hypothetical protein
MIHSYKKSQEWPHFLLHIASWKLEVHRHNGNDSVQVFGIVRTSYATRGRFSFVRGNVRCGSDGPLARRSYWEKWKRC